MSIWADIPDISGFRWGISEYPALRFAQITTGLEFSCCFGMFYAFALKIATIVLVGRS